MKKFLSGVLCATLVFSLALSALAISGKMTIEVDPINVQVNGEVFQPTDVTGKEVPVFAYQGTTYAPLRALAEAYGLEVGYDASANMATVTEPGTSSANQGTPTLKQGFVTPDDAEVWNSVAMTYEEFKGAWEFRKWPEENLQMFSNPMERAGREVYLEETDLYRMGISTKNSFSTPTILREFIETNMMPAIRQYAEDWCKELHVDGRNTGVTFYIDGLVYSVWQFKDGSIGVE